MGGDLYALIHDGHEVQEVADLLNEFYAYAEPDIQGFEEAVGEFKERVPELAQGLTAKIKEAYNVPPPDHVHKP